MGEACQSLPKAEIDRRGSAFCILLVRIKISRRSRRRRGRGRGSAHTVCLSCDIAGAGRMIHQTRVSCVHCREPLHGGGTDSAGGLDDIPEEERKGPRAPDPSNVPGSLVQAPASGAGDGLDRSERDREGRGAGWAVSRLSRSVPQSRGLGEGFLDTPESSSYCVPRGAASGRVVRIRVMRHDGRYHADR